MLYLLFSLYVICVCSICLMCLCGGTCIVFVWARYGVHVQCVCVACVCERNYVEYVVCGVYLACVWYDYGIFVL